MSPTTLRALLLAIALAASAGIRACSDVYLVEEN